MLASFLSDFNFSISPIFSVGMSPSAHSSDETRKRCVSRTVRREPTVSGQHTQPGSPHGATQGRGQGMLRARLGPPSQASQPTCRGAGWDSHLHEMAGYARRHRMCTVSMAYASNMRATPTVSAAYTDHTVRRSVWVLWETRKGDRSDL